MMQLIMKDIKKVEALYEGLKLKFEQKQNLFKEKILNLLLIIILM